MKFTRLASAVILCTASLPILAASYTVTELATDTIGQNQYGVSIDNTGTILTVVENIYNAPIDLSTIDFESAEIIAGLTDIESARNGQYNLADYTFLVNRAISGSSNFSFVTQQIGRLQGYKTDGSANNFEFINAFDIETEALGGFSYSMETTPRDSAAGTHIVGNTVGPFRAIDYVNEDGLEIKYILSDFDRRAFVQVGENVTPLLPIDTTLGGTSQVNSINANYVVAGSGSIAASSELTVSQAVCVDETTRGDQPIEACNRNIILVTSGGTRTRRAGLWLQRAHVWSLDVDGNVVNTITYGTLITDEEPDSQGSSQALDVNNSGVSVGIASIKAADGTIVTTAAAMFLQSGEVVQVIDDEDLLPNSAIAINDSGYIVGLRSQSINRISRNKMFISNMNDGSVTFPTDFFDSSSTIPRAINNNNLVVGSADIEATNTVSRKTAAFIYDIQADTFTNLNTLISCDSPFDLIEGKSINDNNEIIVSALTKKPSRDKRGQVIKDDNGDDVLIDAVITLKLSPTGQAASACSDEELGIEERQAASTGMFLFTILAFATFFRRRLKK
ncbi:MAG: hypothetical protein ACI89W_001401 [Gammaproteobacteria bacterium]|jgi:hypothetical protein